MAEDFTLSAHFKQRCFDLNEYESERHQILSQCGKCADVLYAEFRYDEICFAFEKFKTLGLDLKTLFKFQEEIRGVVYPWNAEYNTLRQDVNRRFNIFPLIIVMCRTEEDVIQAYRFAREYNIEVALRGGSHSFEAYSLVSEGMIIDQSRRKKILVCPKKRITTVEPGTLLGPLVDKLSKYGLMYPVGSCPNNGIQYALGGGISSYIRSFGTGSDNMLEAKVLLANGQVVTANNQHYSDLFWALRGAGIGNYGIVLSLTLRVFPLNEVYRFQLDYEFKDIKEVLKTWFDWIQTNPIELTSDFVAFNNKGSVSITGLYLGNRRCVLEERLSLLKNIGKVEVNVRKIPFIDAVRINAGKGRWQPFFKFKNNFVSKSFPLEALEIIEHYMSIGDGGDYFILDNLGGVNNHISPTATAFAHRGFLAWLHVNAQWSNEDKEGEKLAWITQFFEKLQPYLSFQVYQNTPDITLEKYLERYYAENLSRLVQIKQKYDPQNVFHYAQSIPPHL